MALLEFPKLNSTLGTLRAYHLAAIIFVSSFLAGYDSGIAGGILSYKTFEDDFRYTSGQESKVSSLTVGLEQLGSFVASLFAYYLTDKFGRKWVIIGSTAVFCIGVIIQVINTHSLGAWYAARIIAGIGMGGQSVVVPMYSAEMTPKEIRGRCGSFYQWLYTWGILAAYWIDYGVAASASISKTSREWQIPVGLQLVSGGIMVIGACTLPESVRWLLSQNRTDEAWKSLTWIRGDEGEKTIEEFKETQLGLKAEKAAKENFSLRELWEPANRLRFCVGPMLFVFQNATGSSALAVFAPQYFKLLVGSGGNRDLLLTGLFGAVKFIACTFFILFLAERFGRRMLLTGGSAFMAVCMLITALIVKCIPTESSTSVTSAGRATVAMLYLDIMVYNCSWGPVPWAYVPEIFPTRIRALGLACSMLAHWATSFCFSFASPYMIDNIGANTFLLFMAFDITAALFCFVFVRETRGQNLEVAAGTEWDVVEKSADGLEASEKGEIDPDRPSQIAVAPGAGKQLEVVAVHDTYGLNFKRRS
ncbi:MFS quinate transporter [Aspergillus costaricaensis CBS 115574]|uniref:MFS quinate transporter n=1 Tax=Aspergillus costaricaensis CBS 115574 TaxID=1448317 RepID=A0ACD1ITT0_9EURO|nr:MFS quinate transporter [Aspergillus costaricaensis CBS 115574]RAK93744.1 MFS quinate transporter [Aspergillus costaricaensis CBS 115574]